MLVTRGNYVGEVAILMILSLSQFFQIMCSTKIIGFGEEQLVTNLDVIYGEELPTELLCLRCLICRLYATNFICRFPPSFRL